MKPIVNANTILFRRYLDIAQGALRSGGDPWKDDDRLSLENLIWMIQTGIDEGAQYPIDKMSRWLGFIQGCMAMRGMIDSDEERDFSRPLFHKAYASMGLDKPATLEKAKPDV